jgi:hypothetical protein
MDRPIPDDLRELCEEAGGESMLRGNLNLFPLESSNPLFEDACLAVVGDDLASFLRGWGAYYALLFEEPEALREIAPNLPDELASLDENGSDDEFYAILGWANPNLPDPRPSASERGLTAEQVDEFARSDGR